MLRRSFLFLILILILLVLPAQAVEITVSETLVVDINLTEGWTLHLEPPDALVKAMAVHVAHEPAAADATAEQIESVARKRMVANEAIVYHAASGAHLDIDFSPLAPGQSAPGTRALRDSAEYAIQSLAGEEDVSAVAWEINAVKVKGALRAFQLEAEYKQHDLPVKFLGIIGYVEGSWFFLYYTDPGNDPKALGDMRSMLEQLIVHPSGASAAG